MEKFMDQLAAHLEAHLNRLDALRGNEGRRQPGGDKPIAYGTAGFRGRANEIEHIFFNLGLYAAIRCAQLNTNIGVMITASHNPIEDNGVKLIDGNGGMLEVACEQIVEEICNTSDKDQLLSKVRNLLSEYDINPGEKYKGRVLIGYDTRPSSESLVDELKRGLDVWKSCVEYTDYGRVTTPALHFLVAESNKESSCAAKSPDVYYNKLINGLVMAFDNRANKQNERCNYSPNQLVVDCANGVGSKTMQILCNNKSFSDKLPTKLINCGEGTLNYLCGADYVKTSHRHPTGANEIGKRYASLDGDADRLVYFYLVKENPSTGGESVRLKLLDGDKIMTLFAIYLKNIMQKANLDQKLSLGIVQTAYANGASTDYIEKQLNLKIDCVNTGVKNLLAKAKEYDLSIYFEANGHGTLYASPKALSEIENMTDDSNDLNQLFKIVNNYIGDAISDILVVETILKYFDWSIEQWDELYQDKPNLLTKVAVKSRDKVISTNAGRTVVEPHGLQQAIDSIVSEYPSGTRCFIRASGTEDAVRVYGEACKPEHVSQLVKQVEKKVLQFCG